MTAFSDETDCTHKLQPGENCAICAGRLAARSIATQRAVSNKLADDLERLCCAETEGKFFDLVTENIGTILAALRGNAALSASPVAQEPVANVNNDRCKLDDDPAPVASVTQVCSCSDTCAADGFSHVAKPTPQYDALGRRMEPVAMPDAQKDALARCYGRLWLVHTDNKSIHLARRELLSWLTKDEQAWGIEHAKAEALAWPSRTAPPATPAGLGADEKCVTYRNALLWAFDRLTVTGGMNADEQRRMMREIGNVLTGKTSPAATYQPNDWDDSTALLSRAGDQK